MGTSQSKPPAKGGSPLIPSWADQDPPPDGAPPVTPPPNQEKLESHRNSGMKRSLGKYFSTGDQTYARRALGQFSRGSMGGGKAAPQRLARAARVGGAAFAALISASSGQPPASGGLNLISLTGASIEDAIGAIVDNFCPPGILDEEAIRAAMSEALAEALDGLDTFDPNNIDPNAVVLATRSFVAELVFNAIMSEAGKAEAGTSPKSAIDRENGLRDLIHEITDLKATPKIEEAGNNLTSAQIENLVTEISKLVYEEMANEY